MTHKKINPEWLAGTRIPSVEYAELLSDVPCDELRLFAAKICEQVIEIRVVAGSMRRPPRIGTETITNPTLLRALSGLDKSIYGKQASKNSQPGKIRRTQAWEVVKTLHTNHRSEYAKRSMFVKFALSEMNESIRPEPRTVDGWVRVMDEQLAG